MKSVKKVQSYRDKEGRKLTAPMITLLFKIEGTE